jgi:dihydroorotase
MSLYLHESITPETIIKAKQAGITGVKSYPAGVTTYVKRHLSFLLTFQLMMKVETLPLVW